ncbi:hypothetical protein BN946_scf184573.g12 [Trametes cinnabarina]|uniref:Uncharacterized protein n=1 Tax=Pycnoporus cinnabarinus TaxID=5643 RepID=A0A060SE39_PYCCI|nr:hypothetical protein BN946_scf184573.g12 [Trametes cinnabarina]
MPKPRKNPAEVAADKKKIADEKEVAKKKAEAARQHVLELEAKLTEDAPITQPDLRRSTRSRSGKHNTLADSTDTRSLSPGLTFPGNVSQILTFRNALPEFEGTSTPQLLVLSSTLLNLNLPLADPEDEHPEDDLGSPAPDDDDYSPELDSGESEMEIDKDEDEAATVQIVKRGKQKVAGKRGGKKQSGSAAAVGKRKQDALGDSEPDVSDKCVFSAIAVSRLLTSTTILLSSVPAKSKKAKASDKTALVANWQEVLTNPKIGSARPRSPSPYSIASDVPDDILPNNRPDSRLSTASSVPPSTTGSTTDSDGCGLGEDKEGAGVSTSESLDNHAGTYSLPSSHKSRPATQSIRINDVREALRYRSQAVEGQGARPSNTQVDARASGSASRSEPTSSGSRPVPEIAVVPMARVPQHPLTKVTRPDLASQAKASGVTDVKPTAAKQKRQRRVVGADGSTTKSRPTISALPAAMQQIFATHFIPLARQFAGTLDPWTDIKFSEYKSIHRRAFGDLAKAYPLEEDDVCHKLIHNKISDWRAKFALTAVETWKEMISDPELAEVLTGPEYIGQYAVFLLGDGKAGAPFYWREWNGGEKKLGRLQGRLIIGSLASHILELQNVPLAERTGESPRGALGMATLAALHVLTHNKSGEWNPPSGRAGWFSGDNYSDSVVFVNGKHKNDKKLTRIMKVVDDLTASEWLEIMDDARAVMVQRQTAPGKRMKAGTKGAAAATVHGGSEDHAESDGSDSDVMLVADA